MLGGHLEILFKQIKTKGIYPFFCRNMDHREMLALLNFPSGKRLCRFNWGLPCLPR